MIKFTMVYYKKMPLNFIKSYKLSQSLRKSVSPFPDSLDDEDSGK